MLILEAFHNPDVEVLIFQEEERCPLFPMLRMNSQSQLLSQHGREDLKRDQKTMEHLHFHDEPIC